MKIPLNNGYMTTCGVAGSLQLSSSHNLTQFASVMKIYTLHVPSIILSMLQSIFVTQDQNFTRLKNKHQIPIHHIRKRLYVFQEFKVISNNLIRESCRFHWNWLQVQKAA